MIQGVINKGAAVAANYIVFHILFWVHFL